MWKCFVLLFCLVWCTPICRAQEKESEIQKAIDQYVSAYNQGELAALESCWTENAVWIHADGTKTEGRSSIRAILEQGLARKATMEISDSWIRLIADNVAVEEGTASLSLEGNLIGTERYEAIHVATDQGWKLASLRDLPSLNPTAANPNLTALSWLIGEWEPDSGESGAKTSFQWTRGNAFLVNHFSAEFPEEEPIEGAQVIGWDPISGGIRSWLFDSDGTFGSGVWQPVGDSWVVRSEMVLADGRIAKSTNIYTLQDENSFLWKSIGRKVGDQSLPNIENLRMVRKGQARNEQEPAAGAESADSATPGLNSQESPSGATDK